MAAVSKIDNGVIELHTDVGRLYVCPTGWGRLYLRWTFRNFHSLPREILNRRQKRLIDALCRSAVVSPAERIPSSAIIGIVENVKVLALPSTGEVSEAAKVAPAVTQNGIAVLQATAENGVQSEPRHPVSRLSPPAEGRPQITPSGSQDISANSLDEDNPLAAEQVENASGGAKRGRPWAIAAVSCAALAALLLAIYLPQRQEPSHSESTPKPARPAPSVVVQQQPAAAPPQAPAKQKVQGAGQSEKPQTSPGVELAAAGSKRREAETGGSVPMPKAADAMVESAPLPEIADAPRSGFIYPVAPSANLVGKVVLKAVVGSDGAVKQVEVVSGERALAAAAARAVKQWRYAPPQVDGRAVEAQTQVTISFLGDDAISIILPQPK